MSQSDHGHAQLFMSGLRQAESTGNIRSLTGLFAENAQLENLTRSHACHSGRISPNHSIANAKSDPASFWRQYLSAFSAVKSHFTRVTECGSTVMLEWQSTGKLANGTYVDYNGVSILETDGILIKKFRTYYDSAALLPHASKSEKSYSDSVGTPTISTQASS